MQSLTLHALQNVVLQKPMVVHNTVSFCKIFFTKTVCLSPIRSRIALFACLCLSENQLLEIRALVYCKTLFCNGKAGAQPMLVQEQRIKARCKTTFCKRFALSVKIT